MPSLLGSLCRGSGAQCCGYPVVGVRPKSIWPFPKKGLGIVLQGFWREQLASSDLTSPCFCEVRSFSYDFTEQTRMKEWSKKEISGIEVLHLQRSLEFAIFWREETNRLAIQQSLSLFLSGFESEERYKNQVRKIYSFSPISVGFVLVFRCTV